MAVDMFMKIDDIKGESADASHKDEIDVLAWSWGMSNSGSAQSGGGAGSGKANVQDLSLTKYVDKSTPELMKLCCSGTHFKNAKLVVRKAGGKKPLEYIVLELTDGMISAVSAGGSGGEDRLTENVTLNFRSYKYTYTAQKPDGSGEGGIIAQWDMSKNAEK